MRKTELLRDQLRQAHACLDLAVSDVSDEHAHWHPPGIANPLGATYAHLLLGEDGFSSSLHGSEPLFATAWVGRVGVSELPPLAESGGVRALKSTWYDWGRRVRVDLPTLRQYAVAVQDASDRYLASLSDDDLCRPLDLGDAGLGEQTLGWVVSAGLIGHVLAHWGEIACLKGLQGCRGYPL